MRIAKGWIGLAFLVALMVTGCGGGGGDAQTSSAVARVEIQQTGVILTQRGEVKQLSAEATDAAGFVVNVPITWTSTKASAIVVDASGKLTATASNGSSQVVAEAGGIKSAPLLALVTQPALNAILLTDAQIVGQPVETTPGALPSFDNTYQVSLAGVNPPIVGSILISTESKAVAGRVLMVDSTTDPITVTLGLVSPRELFPNLDINETIELANAQVTIPEDITADYEVKRTGNTFTFTPKANLTRAILSGVTSITAAAVGTNPLPLFITCETTTPAGMSFMLNSISITINPKLEFIYTRSNGLERLVVSAEPTVMMEGGVQVSAVFEGQYECKKEVFVYRVPIGGALSFLISGLVPVGIGFEVGGKLTVATMEIGTEAEVKATTTVGIACPSGNNCEFVRSLGNFDAKVTPILDIPSIGDLRLEPFLTAFGYFEAEIGNPLLNSLRFNAFDAKAGGRFDGSFATVASQLADPAYQSDFKVSLDGSANVGNAIGDVLKLFGVTIINAVNLTIDTDIAKSPRGLAVTADHVTFLNGETVNFHLSLDPDTVSFFPLVGPYNVNKIQLLRSSGGTANVVGTVSASAGQTEFDIPFTAPNSGTIAEFSAFVVTSLLPSDLLALEVGTAVGTAAGGSRIGPGANHTCARTTTGGVKCWGNYYFGQLGNGLWGQGAGLPCGPGSPCERILPPVFVTNLTSGVAAVSANWNHACALTTKGGVKCWGSDYYGLLGDGGDPDSDIPVPVDVVGLTSGVTAISAGINHNCAVTIAGGVKCWGLNLNGQLGHGIGGAPENEFSGPFPNKSAVPVDVTGLTSGVAAVSAGAEHTCALTTTGGVKCWGSNYLGQLGLGTGGGSSPPPIIGPTDVPGLTSGVAAISAGYGHTCALMTAGGVKCWGYVGPLGDGRLGDENPPLYNGPVDVVGLTSGVAAISASFWHSCALTTTGGVKCWPYEDGNGSPSAVPVDVPGLTSGVAAISAGDTHDCVLTTTGGVKCWGLNVGGKLGDGIVNSRVPVDVADF